MLMELYFDSSLNAADFYGMECISCTGLYSGILNGNDVHVSVVWNESHYIEGFMSLLYYDAIKLKGIDME